MSDLPADRLLAQQEKPIEPHPAASDTPTAAVAALEPYHPAARLLMPKVGDDLPWMSPSSGPRMKPERLGHAISSKIGWFRYASAIFPV